MVIHVLPIYQLQKKKRLGSIQAAASHRNSVLQLTGSARVMKMVKIIAAKHQYVSFVVIVNVNVYVITLHVRTLMLAH